MATATGNYVHDNSSFANFAGWATPIHEALIAFGWKQTADTGQVMWLGANVTAAANVSGSIWRYTYSGLTTSGVKTAFEVGDVVTMTGWTGGAAGNNGTFVITSLAGGAGTFDVVNASGATVASGGTGVITKQAAVPSSAYLNELWAAQDTQAATQPIVWKIEYGFNSTTVRIRVTPGTGSDGAGNITGAASSVPWQITNLETNNGATTYPCYFSGDSGEFRMYMWQTTANNNGVLFGLERSKDSSGNKTTDYFSAVYATANAINTCAFQCLSNSGNSPQLSQGSSWPAGGSAKITTGSSGSVVACYPVFPLKAPTVQLGNPMLGFVAITSADTADGASVTITQMYAGTHVFLVAARGNFGGIFSINTLCPAMRYE